jgi:AmmeMemoRadiSam system protein B
VVDGFIAGAGQSIEEQVPKVIIAPHGGYVFSGRIAGKAFGGWKGTTVRRVVLIGPSHSYDFPGIALPDTSVFATPLGELHVDREAIGRVEKFAFVRRFEAAHHPELSLEVQLPFIQRLFGEPSIIPLVTGSTDSGQVGKVLDTLWGGPETVFVISSDLSQRRPYELVQKLDYTTARAIASLRHHMITGEQACGYRAIRGLLQVAIKREMRCVVAELGNSGNVGGTDEVTGYGAFQFFEI